MQEQHRKINAVKTAEMRLLMYLLEHNLPFSMVSSMVDLLKVVAPDSQIVKGMKCGRTKFTSVTNTILREEGLEDVAKDLRKWKFSVIIDETTDIATKKCLAVVVRYFDDSANVVRVRFLALIEMQASDAKTISTTLMEFLNSLQIPLSHFVGFASDNASVMMGAKGGVQALLKIEIPNLFVLGCVCHSLHLCSAAACKKIPASIEKLARNIYLFFCHSSKRLLEFKELLNVKTHKLLKTASTRWLSLEQVVNRILEQWVPLTHYFRVCEIEDDRSGAGKEISRALDDEAQVYFSFLSYVFKLTNDINKEFQSEKPRLHVLRETTKVFVSTLLTNFVHFRVIEKGNFKKQDYTLSENFLKVDDIKIGAKAKLIIDKMPRGAALEIKKCSREYYIELIKQVLSRIDINDPVLKALEIINPSKLGPSISPLLSEFPTILPTNIDVDDVEIEWDRVLQQSLVEKKDDLETFWGKIFEIKNAFGELIYPNLKLFVGSILALPHSSACAERIFSKTALIKNKQRNKLEVPTVNSIMLANGLLGNLKAHRWIPSKELVEKYRK